jgi:hypothetical protein
MKGDDLYPPMKIEYMEVGLQSVLEYYAKDFAGRVGESKPRCINAYVDSAKGMVVFVLAVEASVPSNLPGPKVRPGTKS